MSFAVLLPAAVILTILAGLIGRAIQKNKPVPVPIRTRPAHRPESRDRR